VVPCFDGDANLLRDAAEQLQGPKRIKKGSPALRMGRGAPMGRISFGPAEILTDPDVAAKMAPVYAQKYWIAWLGLFKPNPRAGCGAARPSSSKCSRRP